ncbi:MAG TPA: hypothetical protein PKN33_11105 [Phycisphaerae bacterium]|nr:hypothetical protein [Phycisphaerae bacterium]
MAGKSGDGDVWVWVALDSDSKVVISYLVGDRSAGCAYEFIGDLAGRVVKRIQLTSDGYFAYPNSVLASFGHDVDYGVLIKVFGPDASENSNERRYSPGTCNGSRKVKQLGMPDRRYISTSYVERQNASLRLFNKRFSRLTLALSKRLINHQHAVFLHYFAHNFMRKCRTIGTTPAMAAGIADKVWTADDLISALEDEEQKLAKGGRINREDRS